MRDNIVTDLELPEQSCSMFIKADFKILLLEPAHPTDPFYFTIPSAWCGQAAVDIDLELGKGAVFTQAIKVPIQLKDWLLNSAAGIYSSEYPKEFSNYYSEFYKELKNIATQALNNLKFFAAQDEIADSPALVKPVFEYSFDGNTYSKIPRLFAGSAQVRRRMPTRANEIRDLQHAVDNGIVPFVAMRHLYRAIREGNPRFKWIDATIAAELAIKEALLRAHPEISVLLLDLPSPPLTKLYGSVMKEYFGTESPYKKIFQNGVTKRNILVHSPKEDDVSLDEATQYVHSVMRAVHHLYTLLYPDWDTAKRLHEMDHQWQGENSD
jgi:hypothetical protein